MNKKIVMSIIITLLTASIIATAYAVTSTNPESYNSVEYGRYLLTPDETNYYLNAYCGTINLYQTDTSNINLEAKPKSGYIFVEWDIFVKDSGNPYKVYDETATVNGEDYIRAKAIFKIDPSPTPTFTPTITIQPTITPSPTPTISPSPTPTSTPTPTPTQSPTNSPTPTPTITPTLTPNPTPEPTKCCIIKTTVCVGANATITDSDFTGKTENSFLHIWTDSNKCDFICIQAKISVESILDINSFTLKIDNHNNVPFTYKTQDGYYIIEGVA